ncbi:hypothetical protein LPB86_00610 [Pedobacter sp. MC2016-14]|uniref:hypothetical protein n=1 Tax=Pedobacter sp. MC2016-14 TaxID=2897327 RepID=UPI001E57CE75|nr:hypothetical protein [Pedobacter sp. MC2016-14]MCD0486706.1 hypothetical protein [Pedobacter sp. MC2016-14]
MNPKRSLLFFILAIAWNFTLSAQTTLVSYTVENKNSINLGTSKGFVNNLIDSYKFKKGVPIDSFTLYNTAVLPLARVSRNTYKKCASRVYSKLLKNPIPEGPGNICVDKTGCVSTYAYVISSSRDINSINSAYETLVNKMSKTVDPKYIVNNKDGVAINIPDSGAIINIRKIDAGQWHALSINFN